MSAQIHLKIELIPVEKIQPYEKNAKLHTEAQTAKLARAIAEGGWDQPIVVDKDFVIIKGHGRRLAALKLGMKKVPVVVRADLTPDQVKAARLSDNRVAMGDYDTELLQEELRALASADFDLSGLGFDERELSFLTDSIDDANLDAVLTDLNTAVERHTSDADAAVAAADARQVPIAKALGFKSIAGAAERDVAQFMAIIEGKSGANGADAFLAFCRRVVEAEVA